MAVIVGDTYPDLWVGAIIGLLIVFGQNRSRLWLTDKISTRPIALAAFGLLVLFGYAGAVGPLGTARSAALWITLVAGCALGVVRSWTLRMWLEPIGIRVQGSPATLVLWCVTIVGSCIVYGVYHVGFEGLVLLEGVSFGAQQLATIVRGARARSALTAQGVTVAPLWTESDASGPDANGRAMNDPESVVSDSSAARVL